jgi:hypothetical protein
MNRIPAEVFISIMSYLPLSDKMECILVSRQWHEIIAASNLYEELSFREYETFSQALGLFCRKAAFGESVRKLSLYILGFTEKADSLLLPLLLPNIEKLECLEEHKFETLVMDKK